MIIRIEAGDHQINGLKYERATTEGIKISSDEIGLKIRRLRVDKHAIQTEDASLQDMKTRIDARIPFLEDLTCELTEYDEQFVKMPIDKITVCNDHLIVEFNPRIEIEIDEYRRTSATTLFYGLWIFF